MIKTYGIVAYPASHSLSPEMHNAAFKALKIGAKYRVFDVKPENFGDLIKDLHKNKIEGLNVSMPYKEEVIQYLDGIDPTAKKIGAVNCIYKKGKKYYGANYDWKGIVEPLKKITKLKGKKVLLLGAGGAAKAACFGLKKEGANVFILNRTFATAKELARKYGFKATETADSMPDIVINCTSVGFENPEESPINPEVFKDAGVVLDIIYGHETKFVSDAKAAGVKFIITGEEVLLHQGYATFKKWTGSKAPREIMKKSIRNF
ncbi:MAG: shikimate 5-dehydrogenase, shikimate dehydrogenase [Candidatus Peregrinibacteria bacterium GW2011_GWF2_43_17]|nr:MAG: shikimate 5-dehydrogenase, shikimate dehydrogenase [Candidatus Peregrinibacteria bacterium GW2011_GWF2_43_17]KKT19675.1 MAG: Shikimate dehydrogenase [Candidatus Peregrinibacteria bacterium GW2011_GWA2_43_8]HAU40035.1 shikimate dehydrogenase [Candidatus Peregrinibacteria bacterium]